MQPKFTSIKREFFGKTDVNISPMKLHLRLSTVSEVIPATLTVHTLAFFLLKPTIERISGHFSELIVLKRQRLHDILKTAEGVRMNAFDFVVRHVKALDAQIAERVRAHL